MLLLLRIRRGWKTGKDMAGEIVDGDILRQTLVSNDKSGEEVEEKYEPRIRLG